MFRFKPSTSSRLIAFAAKLDLGRKWGGGDMASCSDTSKKSQVDYPTIRVDGKPDPIDLPDSGKAVVAYKEGR